MASIINALTSGTGGIVTTGDASGNLQLQTANTAAVTIDTSQNVGFNTTTPTQKIDVLGKIQIQQDSGSNNRLILRGQPTSSYRWNIDNYGSSNNLRIFRENDSDSSAGAVVATIGTGGMFALQGGNITSGTGIAFPATQSASSDANTLDDYEEGTWTPTLTSQSGSITSYTVTNGTYTKIGNTVSVIVYISMTNAGTAGGTLTLTLPIAPANEYWAGFGGEVSAVGFSLNVFGTVSSLGFRKYENSTAAGTSYGYKIGAVYRSA